MHVEDVMTTEPVTVGPDSTVKHALGLLDHHHVTSLPVVDAGLLCGVVSEADLVRDLVAVDPRSRQVRSQVEAVTPQRVEEVMTRHAVTVRSDTDLAVAVELMTTTTVKSLPVVDRDGRVVGMLSRSDVVRCYARADRSLEREVLAALSSVGIDDLVVRVRDGIAEVAEDDPADSTLARVMISSVPGVIDVRAL